MLRLTFSRVAVRALMILPTASAESFASQDGVAPYLDLGPSKVIAVSGWNPGDVNADGFADLFAWRVSYTSSASDPDHLYVLKGPDGGVLLDLTPVAPGAWYFVWAEGAADLNGDGYRDLLATVGGTGVSAIEVRSGVDGSLLTVIPAPTMLIPGFGMATAFYTGAFIVNAGDLNGDGGEEFIVHASFGGGFNAVLVHSAPSLQVLYAYGPLYGAIGNNGVGGLPDVDGDGRREFLLSPGTTNPSPGGPTWVEFYSGATGSPILSIVGTSAAQIFGACGLDDVNGDGLPEVALNEYLTPGTQIRVVSLPSLSTLYTIPATSVPMRIEDADGDGINDVLVRGSYWQGDVEIYSGTTGALVGGSLGSLYSAFGDVSGDGLADYGTNFGALVSSTTVQPAATSLSWPGLMAPPSASVGVQAMIYAPRNFRLSGLAVAGGSATFNLLVPKHPNRTFVVALSLEGSFPGIPVGPFYFPLENDPLLQASLAAGIGGAVGSAGSASIAIPIPPNPGLQGLEVLASGVVLDPTGPLGIGCVLTGVSFVIQ